MPDPRSSFDDAVDAYDAVRPGYPPPLFDELFGLLPTEPHLIEVGPGTGQATRDLLARGASVHAIELGRAMAARLRTNLPSSRLTITVGDFERTDVVSESADGLVSATAYHWISHSAQTERPVELLRPGGVVAIIDTIQVESPDDHGFFAAAQPIYDRLGEPHRGAPAPTRDRVDPAVHRVFASDHRFTGVSVWRFDWNQTYDTESYRTLLESYSVTQLMEPAVRQRLLDEIAELIEHEFGGVITRPLVVTLTTARVMTDNRTLLH